MLFAWTKDIAAPTPTNDNLAQDFYGIVKQLAPGATID